MLKEFIDAIAGYAVAAKAVQIISIPGEPAHVSHVLVPGHGLERMEATPKPRRHKVGTLDEIVRAVDMWGFGADADVPDFTLWYDRTGITMVIDDSTRRDTVTLPLSVTPQFAELQALDGRTVPINQTDLLWKLRSFWAQFLAGEATSTINAFRELKWTLLKESQSNQAIGKASLGTKILAEVGGAAKLPDVIAVRVPVFVQRLEQVPAYIEIVIDPDPAKEQFKLAVVAGACEQALQNAEQRIGNQLCEMLPDHVDRIFYGTP
jgi:hypothetical protein